MYKKLLTGLIFGLVLTGTQQVVFAQNYWGDGNIQAIEGEPMIDEDKKLPVTVIEDTKTEKTSIQKPEEINKHQVQPPQNKILELGTSTRKLPVGMKLNIVMNTPLNAKITKEGMPFSATIKDDVVIDNELILPSGTLIRGRVGKVKKSGFFSKSGSVLLNFDHIVTPLGKEINLDLEMAESANINKNGAIVAGSGFGDAVKDSLDSGINIVKSTTQAGYNAGMASGAVPVVVTVPVTAVAGTVAGTTVFLTKSTLAVFNRGANPVVNAGDTFEVSFSDSVDLPVN